jgi:hypothetical protein
MYSNREMQHERRITAFSSKVLSQHEELISSRRQEEALRRVTYVLLWNLDRCTRRAVRDLQNLPHSAQEKATSTWYYRTVSKLLN